MLGARGKKETGWRRRAIAVAFFGTVLDLRIELRRADVDTGLVPHLAGGKRSLDVPSCTKRYLAFRLLPDTASRFKHDRAPPPMKRRWSIMIMSRHKPLDHQGFKRES